MRKLNILNIATNDFGGAGIASLNYNRLLNIAGHNSVLLVKNSNFQNNEVVVLKPGIRDFMNRVFSRIKFEWNKINSKKVINTTFDTKYSFYNIDENHNYISAHKILGSITFQPDVIILHWISRFINTKTIGELANLTNAKIIWIMMDNSPLTGGCHYPWDCKGYQSDCSNCPAILVKSKKRISKENLSLKIKYLPNNIEIMAASNQDYKRALKSKLFHNKKVHSIFLPIDENKFKPLDKPLAKKYFNIGSNKRVIFYGAASFDNKRKGGDSFFESIMYLQKIFRKENKLLNDFVILVAGNGDRSQFSTIDIPIQFTGFLDEDSLIKAYQAADVFLLTSLEDSGPLMVNQSLMCGTPVVGFNIGVAPDLVSNGETGYISKLFDNYDLAKGLFKVLSINDKEYNVMSEKCREASLERFSQEVGLNLFNTMLEV